PPRVIAKRFGEPVETVKSRLKRALNLLRKRLDPADAEGRQLFGATILSLSRGPAESLLFATIGAKAAATGVLVMTTTAKSAAAIVALILIACGFFYALREKATPDEAPARTNTGIETSDELVRRPAGAATILAPIKPGPAVEEEQTSASPSK